MRIEMTKRQLLPLCTLVLMFAGSVFAAEAKAAQGPATQSQIQTLLPDGRLLIISSKATSGGVESTATLKDQGTGATNVLSPGLNVARAGHTATVLPDGTVLIFGGLGGDGQIVRAAELFDP